MLIDFCKFNQLTENKKLLLLNEKVSYFALSTREGKYVQFSNAIGFVNNEQELLTLIHSLKYADVLFKEDGIVRLLIKWEQQCNQLFESYFKKYRINLRVEDLVPNDEVANQMRSSLRIKDFNTYLELSIGHFFKKLKIIKEYSVDLDKVNVINYIELKSLCLESFEYSLYI